MSDDDVPAGWRLLPLDEAASIEDGRRVPLNSDERATRRGPYPYFGANGQVDSIDDYRYEGDHVLVAEDGGYFDEPHRGVAYLVGGRFWVNNHAHVLRPRDGVQASFLRDALNRVPWMEYVSGTTRLKLTQAALRRVRLPIPSPDEQGRIVAKLDALRARSQRAKDALDAVPALLDRLRQSILAAAFRGDLTADWREQSPDVEPASELLQRIRLERRKRSEEAELVKMGAKGGRPTEERSKLKYVESDQQDRDLPELPDNWCWVRLPDLLSWERVGMRTGPFGTLLGRDDYRADGVPIVGVGNIARMQFSRTWSAFVSPEKAALLHEYSVVPGDLLVSRSGTVGEVCVVPADVGPAILSTNVIRLCPDERLIRPAILGFALVGATSVLDQIHELCSGSTRDFLNQSILSDLLIPLPPTREQDAILSLLGGIIRRVDSVERQCRAMAKRVSELERAVLAAAFRGDLVERQSDPPAPVRASTP